MAADNVQLVLPATPEYARIVRLTVAGLASRGGFGYDDVEDLRIAVGEACTLLLHDAGPGGSLRFSFVLDDRILSIDAERDGPSAEASEGEASNGSEELATQDHQLSEQILSAVVDESEIADGGRAVKLVKVRAGA